MRTVPDLVQFIREKCKDKNTSLTKLEELFGWANGTIGKWSKGKKYPPHDKLQMISDYFGISVSELTGEQKEKPSADDGEELSPEEKELYEILESASPDMIRAILDIAKIVQKEDVYRKMIILEMEADK